MFAETIKVTEKAVQRGDKIDSFQETIALEIVSQFGSSWNGGPLCKRVHQTVYSEASLLCTKKIIPISAGDVFSKLVVSFMCESELLMLSFVLLLVRLNRT